MSVVNLLVLLLLLKLLLLLLLFVVMVLVDLACEDAFYGIPQAQLLLVVALHVVLGGGLVLRVFGGKRFVGGHLSVVPLVQVVINVLADFGNALDLACVLAAEESRPCVLPIDLGEVW